MLTIVLLSVLGLAAGGLLNVAIDRYPEYLNKAWTAEALEQIGDFDQAARVRTSLHPELLDWVVRCPQCQGDFKGIMHAPILSCLAHRGRFHCCGHKVPGRYFLVEGVTAVLWGLSGCVFGISWELLSILVFMSGLTALAFIDLEHFILPDHIVGPLLFTGLLVNTKAVFAPSLSSAVWGVVGGFLALWLVRAGHRLVGGKGEGLGLGDCKLMAAIGAWIGWELLIPAGALAAGGSLFFSLALIRTGRNASDLCFAFGPFLAGGAGVAVYWSNWLHA